MGCGLWAVGCGLDSLSLGRHSNMHALIYSCPHKPQFFFQRRGPRERQTCPTHTHACELRHKLTPYLTVVHMHHALLYILVHGAPNSCVSNSEQHTKTTPTHLFTMGAAASLELTSETKDILSQESGKDLNAADVDTPRGESAKAEVVRLRTILKARYEAEQTAAAAAAAAADGEAAAPAEAEAAPAEAEAAPAEAEAAPAEADAEAAPAEADAAPAEADAAPAEAEAAPAEAEAAPAEAEAATEA